MKREMGQLRRKMEEAKVTQKVVYRDRIVRAMGSQNCRKSEFEQEKLHQKRLCHMVRWFWGAVFLWPCTFSTGKSGEVDFAGMFGTGFGFIFEYKKSDIFL